MEKKVSCFYENGNIMCARLQIFQTTEDLHFSLMCLSVRITLATIRLKNNVITPKIFEIIRKVKRQFIDKCIRNISNTIELNEVQREDCIKQLAFTLDNNSFSQSQAFINRIREARYFSTLVRQISKFNRLWQRMAGGHPNSSSGNDEGYMYTYYSGCLKMPQQHCLPIPG